MKKYLVSAAGVVLMTFGISSAQATTLFSFETGSPEMATPITSNPVGAYTVGTSTTTGVTNGAQSLSVLENYAAFGGPATAAFTDAAAATALDTASDITVDLTVPNDVFGYGNIDIHFFQGSNPIAADQSQETSFSGSFAADSGLTETLTIPTTLQGAPKGSVLTLDPTLPFSFQIDFSDNSTNLQNGGTEQFYIDNISVPTTITPEPASIAGIVLGGGALLARRRKA